MATKAPKILTDLQAVVRARCAAVLDERGTWKDLPAVEFLLASVHYRAGCEVVVEVSKKHQREMLPKAQLLIEPLFRGRMLGGWRVDPVAGHPSGSIEPRPLLFPPCLAECLGSR